MNPIYKGWNSATKTPIIEWEGNGTELDYQKARNLISKLGTLSN